MNNKNFKFSKGQVVEINVDDNGGVRDCPSDLDLKEFVDEPQFLVYVGRVVEQNKKFVLLQTQRADNDADGNNNFSKVLKAGITDVRYFSLNGDNGA